MTKTLFVLLAGLLGVATAGCGDDDVTVTDSGIRPPSDGGGEDDGGTPVDGSTARDSGTPTGEDFEMTFMAYPHQDQQYGVRVVRESDSTEVGRTTGMQPLMDDFDVTIAGIIEDGESYTVEWYLDANENEAYNPPPMDHAWRLTEQAGTASGLTVMHRHDSDWVDIMWE
jgi:hypothetical protein